jgi:hypothetical protein
MCPMRSLRLAWVGESIEAGHLIVIAPFRVVPKIQSRVTRRGRSIYRFGYGANDQQVKSAVES